MKRVTLLFVRRKGELLLAMKKRGFGEGKWNGVGGKADPNETMRAAAIRECQEEIGVTPLAPKLVGRIDFRERTDPTFAHDTYIYTTESWEGEPRETEEMRPQWFKLSELPYESMWADDPLWYPLMLENKPFVATFTLDGNDIHTHTIKQVTKLEEE